MTVLKSNTFENGLADGTTLTQGSGGNTGLSVAGDYVNSVYIAASATLQASTSNYLNGARCAKYTLTASSGANLGWDITAAPTVVVKGHINFTTMPGSTVFLASIRDSATSASGFSIRMTSAGALSVYNRTASTTLGTLASNISANTYYRYEARFTAAGAWELRVYVGNSATLFASAISGTGVTTSLSNFNYVRFGCEGTSVTATMYLDDIGYADDWFGAPAAIKKTTLYYPRSGLLVRRPGTPVDPNPPGYSLWWDEQFTTLDTTKWNVYNNSTFGAPYRVQRYMSYNATVAAASAGGSGNSLRLISKRENVGGNAFTAGMLDSKTAGWWLPRYFMAEARVKIPHGQGIWPAMWFTAKSGGSTMCELDWMEYFHSQIPGKLLSTLHRTDNSGTPRYNVAKNSGGAFFENPTYDPGWHVLKWQIFPDASGDPTQPNNNIRMRSYINDTLIWDYVDTQALYWSTNGGTENSFWNIYWQGSQIDGEYVGSPDGPLGYDHWRDACTIVGNTGTKPNNCSLSYQGRSIIAPSFTAPAATFETDWLKVWKYIG